MKNSVAVNLLSQMFLAQFSEEEHEALGMAIDALNAPPTHREESQRTQGVGSVEWIPCSERLPKENECVGNVWKYYLIQDEYEDMHVAHLSSRGWKTIESVKALECDVVAWMPLPEPWKGGENE